VPVYYLGDTSAGIRLFREYHPVPADGTDPVARTRAALQAMLTTGSPADPDYRTPWGNARVASVRIEGDTVLVDLTGVPQARGAGWVVVHPGGRGAGGQDREGQAERGGPAARRGAPVGGAAARPLPGDCVPARPVRRSGPGRGRPRDHGRLTPQEFIKKAGGLLLRYPGSG